MKVTFEIRPNDKIRAQRELEKEPITLGRDTDCDLMFGIPCVSSRHARLELNDGQWWICDLGSTNHTFVNGVRVDDSAPIQTGDEIRLGDASGPIIVLKSFELSPPTIPAPFDLTPPAAELHDDPDEPLSTTPATPLSEEGVVVDNTPQVDADAETSVREIAPAVDLPTLPQDRPIEGPVKPVGAAPDVAPQRSAARSLEEQKSQLDEDPTLSPVRFHLLSLLGFGLLAVLIGGIYILLTSVFRNPARGYTGYGLLTGIIGSILLLAVGLYAGRKRGFQERLPGRLLTWLRFHLWLSLIGIWLIVLHAGFNLDGGSGTYTILALLGTILTGIAGWGLYKQVPGRVYKQVGNLASHDVREKIAEIDGRIEDNVAGRSPELAAFSLKVLAAKSRKSIQRIGAFTQPAEEIEVANQIAELGQQKVDLAKKLKRQGLLRFVMRSWLVLHVPIAILFFGFLVFHIYDETEAKFLFASAGPKDFADPESCAVCHKDHYDEWIGSMHAIAQLSPVTDLQNRLVVLKDRFDGGEFGVVVGDLCVKCHAPTSRLGDLSDREDEILDIDERAPAGHFGVSCVACHQIKDIHKTEPFAEDKDQVDFKNAENLDYTQGRKMFGPLGGEDPRSPEADEALLIDRVHPSVGNREHQGVFGGHFNDSSFCASCHTVMVDPEGKNEDGSDNIVTLQNTYKEWLDGDGQDATGNSVNWSALGVDCIDCHGKPLTGLVNVARRLEEDRIDLDARMQLFKEAVQNNADLRLPDDQSLLAADVPDPNEINRVNPVAAVLLGGAETEFDLPLPNRRKHLHTFVGVDYHLEPNLPFRDPNHPRFGDNAKIQAQTVAHIADLMRVAAAIRIDENSVSNEEINVEILNLATGHHLPAGFAFAREMWLEVSISPDATGDRFLVVAGGNEGEPLKRTELLDKFTEGADGKLKNFQAVLWNGDRGSEEREGQTINIRTGETVLQNECVKVLKGQAAVNEGFVDRENFLLPGEIRTLTIKMPRDFMPRVRRIKVRLRFRNYPPEFLDQLADRFLAKQDRYRPNPKSGAAPDIDMWDPDPERAERTRNLINGLRIFEMASDIITIR